MSLRMAVAAATIGAGLLAANTAQARPEMVGPRGDYSPGTILVKTNERRLYLILDSGHAVRYPVGVGKSGKQWAGTTRISGKYRNRPCLPPPPCAALRPPPAPVAPRARAACVPVRMRPVLTVDRPS